ncbi:14187_t:CDS:2 [Gigaspora rosea]|nr:14187_t:CDS:2 [Gigaspora rosea]
MSYVFNIGVFSRLEEESSSTMGRRTSSRFDAGVLVGVFTHRFSREAIKAAETSEDDIILTVRENLSKDILSLPMLACAKTLILRSHDI